VQESRDTVVHGDDAMIEEGPHMVACPGCGDSSSIDLAQDAAAPWARTREDGTAHWAASCGGCGTTWALIDRV
jgi:hypothetical protein